MKRFERFARDVLELKMYSYIELNVARSKILFSALSSLYLIDVKLISISRTASKIVRNVSEIIATTRFYIL